MSITRPILSFERATLNAVRLGYMNLELCELGNQRMEEIIGGEVCAKRVYSSWGVHHVSIDLNGEDEALVIDLDHPVPAHMVDVFDLVTNYGTIEHVNNQFQVFKNVHDMVRTGGIMIHALPPPGHWPNHGRYYYPETFVIQLAEACRYEIINFTVRNCYSDLRHGSDKNLTMVAFLKTRNGFIDKEQFDGLPLLDTGDLTYTGNYTKHGRSRSTILMQSMNYARPYLARHPRATRILRRCLVLTRSTGKRWF